MIQDLIAQAAGQFRDLLAWPPPRLDLASRIPPGSSGGAPIGVVDRATDSLILRMAADLRPVAYRPVGGRLIAAAGVGVTIAAFCLALTKGFQPGPMEAATATAVSVKVGYAMALGAPYLMAAARLAIPNGEGEAWRAWFAWPLALLAAVALAQWLGAPAASRAAMLVGHTALVCPIWIAGTSLPSLAGLLRVAQTQAPTRPASTGALLGLAAGAAGAIAYALFCRETSLAFIAIWYTAGMAGACAVGALLGAWLLRW